MSSGKQTPSEEAPQYDHNSFKSKLLKPENGCTNKYQGQLNPKLGPHYQIHLIIIIITFCEDFENNTGSSMELYPKMKNLKKNQTRTHTARRVNLNHQIGQSRQEKEIKRTQLYYWLLISYPHCYTFNQLHSRQKHQKIHTIHIITQHLKDCTTNFREI